MKLSHQYISVIYGNQKSYGGDQRNCKDKVLSRCGCGIVAALDVLLYLHSYNKAFSISWFNSVNTSSPLPDIWYQEQLKILEKKYFPLFYPFGTNGFSLAAGLNRIFRRHGISLRAKWSVKRSEILQEILVMLSKDIPVILSVGENFPRFWKRQGLKFSKSTDKDLSPSFLVRAHFVTVTAIENGWLKVSSWGQEFYINWDEFLRYSTAESLNLLCNIMVIKEI